MPTCKSERPRTSIPRAFASSAGTAFAIFASGCGGGAPLLHGAHALDVGATAQGAGFSATFATGEARRAVGLERDSAANGATPGAQAAARSQAVLNSMSPSLAPWVSARIGISGDNEGGLTYTGRGIRIDVRHAFEDDDVALSIGGGASGVHTDEPSGPTGVGFDIPVIAGWRSTGGVVTLWAGARGGFEKLVAGSAAGTGLDLRRWYGGSVVGMALGFRHVHGALELDAYYQSLSGSWAGQDVKVAGVTLTPGAGLILTF